MKRKLYLETFGCQMNVLDSELVLSQLRAQGYDSTEDRESADVILYNTCSVREHAEQKVWSRLGELKDRKVEKPGTIIGVIGCMAERDGLRIFERFPQVDLLCGPGELDRLPGMVHNAVVTATGVHHGGTGDTELHGEEKRKEERVETLVGGKQVALMGATSRRSSTLEAAEDHLEMLDLSRTVSPGDDVSQAYVRITRGCNKFCTYCVVPYTRGAEVHRPPQNIIDEVKMLADAGALEVTLLGQTINHYAFVHGDGPGGRVTTFGQLLYLIHEAVPNLPRLRFVTSYPRDFTDEALQAMRDCDRICRYLHVPAQHGDDRVLKMMNRGYTSGEYYEFIDRARGYMPDISLASDFIVGFPTETDAEFEKTAELLRRCRFKNSFIFKYSERPGTVAIKRFKDDIPEAVKRQRNNALLAVQQQVTNELNLEMVGKTVELMVEGESKLVSKKAYPAAPSGAPAAGGLVQLGLGKKAEAASVAVAEEAARIQLVGRTRADQVVVFDGDLGLKGKLVSGRVTGAKGMTLFAELV